MQVAVKRALHTRRLHHDKAVFENELQILSRVNNPRLVKLVGLCQNSKEKLLVVEFMSNGTLYDILQNNAEQLNWPMRVHLSLQTAKAVLGLHKVSPPIIHRDIKSSNVLIDGNWNAKLGDFGLALSVSSGLLRPPAGTLGYLDPEYTTPQMLSTKNDVFSFGILLLEIMSGRNPIDLRYNPPNILDWALPLIKNGKALAICDSRLCPLRDASTFKLMAYIAARCVRNSSARRPNMSDVVRQLQQIRRKISYPMIARITRKLKRIKRTPILYDKRRYAKKRCKSPISSTKSPRRSLKVYDENPAIVRQGLTSGLVADNEIDCDSFHRVDRCSSQTSVQRVRGPAHPSDHKTRNKRPVRKSLSDLFTEPGEEPRRKSIYVHDVTEEQREVVLGRLCSESELIYENESQSNSMDRHATGEQRRRVQRFVDLSYLWNESQVTWEKADKFSSAVTSSCITRTNKS
eukprot:c22574_g1_i2 orf=360-1742(-)